MKIGVYISGLGETYKQDNFIKYCTRFINELSYRKTGISYKLKAEKISYIHKKENTVVSIIELSGATEKVIYKLYEFKYSDLLTQRFNAYNLLTKNFLLFLMVLRKAPVIIMRAFKPKNFNRPYQTLYLFFLLFIISLSIVLLLPACITLILDFLNTNTYLQFSKTIKENFIFLSRIGFSRTRIDQFSKFIVSITALLLLIVPKAQLTIAAMAEEFNCADNYLKYGAQSQEILGNLDQMVEYIAERETSPEIHFHAYSFGSIITLDYLFPYGNLPSNNARSLSMALITVGSPVEFVKAYYPGYFDNRNTDLRDQLKWINIYSIIDALASNFRKEDTIGEATMGITEAMKAPTNINYEATPTTRLGLVNYIFLFTIRAHAMYWDTTTDSQSCLRKMLVEMESEALV